jgi:hypothetical protein
MTNDATRCPYYQRESENVKGRGACVLPYDVMMQSDWGRWRSMILPNNKEECEVRHHSAQGYKLLSYKFKIKVIPCL